MMEVLAGCGLRDARRVARVPSRIVLFLVRSHNETSIIEPVQIVIPR